MSATNPGSLQETHTVKDVFERIVATVTVQKDATGLLWAAGPYHYKSYLHNTEEFGNIIAGSGVPAYNFDPNKLRGPSPFVSSPYFHGTTLIYRCVTDEKDKNQLLCSRDPFVIINYDDKGLLHGISEIHFLNLEDCRKTQANCLIFADGTFGIRERYERGVRVSF